MRVVVWSMRRCQHAYEFLEALKPDVAQLAGADQLI
jgi:hypothetical protein